MRAAALCLAGLGACASLFAASVSVPSPDGRNVVRVSDAPELNWSVERNGKIVLAPSRLGLVLRGVPADPSPMVLMPDAASFESNDAVWTNRFGGNGLVRDNWRGARIRLSGAQPPHRRIDLDVRAYDEGVAIRYAIPRQKGFDAFSVAQELTEFRFVDDPEAWYSDYPSHDVSEEGEYLLRRVSALPAKCLAGIPAVVVTSGGRAAICEAALTAWTGMMLSAVTNSDGSAAFQVHLAPAHGAAHGCPTGGAAPAVSPWRVVMLADDDIGLVRNKDLVLNLNPPPEGGDAAFDWVRTGASGWNWWVNSNNTMSEREIKEHVDFCAEWGWPYYTVDAGWSGRPAATPGLTLDPTPEFNIPDCIAYANAKGVGILLWVHWASLEANGVDETFAKFAAWGAKGVKIDFMCRQDRDMVDWYKKVARLAAKHRLVVNFHAALHPTGTERTWPNVLTRESIRGNEISKWEIPSDAVNTATLPFTRFLTGPGDYTPGGVDNVHLKNFVCQMDRGHRYADMSPENQKVEIYANEVGTRAHALALCVAFDSPLMTLCDWPKRYRAAEGSELLKKLPAVWKRTLPLEGRCGEFYTVVREASDGRVYLAAETVKARTVDVPLTFLSGGEWRAEIVRDDPVRTPKDANACLCETRPVNSRMRLTIPLSDEGGCLVRLTSVSLRQ